jgi:hypothetical protein
MKKKIDKEKGSAIILAILVLAFFMALSMNMFFLAQTKSERAGVKARGVRVLSNIDGGASIGYYELSRASNLVTNGVARRTGTIYTAIPVTISALSTIQPTNVYEGIVMEKYQQYFGGFIDTTTQAVVGGFVDNTTAPAIVRPLRNAPADSAMWFNRDSGESSVTKINELWTTTMQTDINNDTPSIGGFRIRRAGADGTGNRILTINGTQTNQIVETVAGLRNREIRATYIKTLNLPDGNLTYSITVERVVKYADNPSIIEIESDELETITVLFQ